MELQYSTRDLARAAVIAAAYAALAWISNFFGLAFPAIQFRLSEALCVLPCRDRKAAIPGLAVGCLITNLLSPYGLLDLVVGHARHAARRRVVGPLPQRMDRRRAAGRLQRRNRRRDARMESTASPPRSRGCSPTTR